jgi:hypothetical protein
MTGAQVSLRLPRFHRICISIPVRRRYGLLLQAGASGLQACVITAAREFLAQDTHEIFDEIL